MFSYGEGRIGLYEAVRLTLAHDPNLLLQREDVRFQQGLLEEISGAFDWVLGADASYDFREQEVRDSVIEREQQKRDELSAQNRFACGQVPVQDAKIAKLLDALGGQPFVPEDFSENTDGFFQAQLRFFDEKLQLAGSQAEREAILRSREVLLNRELAIARQTREDAAAFCEDTGAQLDRLGSIAEFEEFVTGRVSLRLSKLFRSGVFFAPFIEASYDHTQFKGKKNGFFEDRLDADGNPIFTEFGTKLQRFVDFGGKNVEDLYKAEVGFDLNLPLLRGRGVESTGAPEKAASVDVEATMLALRHGAAVSALNTALAYWQLLAAQERVAVLERSVVLEGQLVELTDQLIAGDVLPRVERARGLAGQANARAQLEGSRRDLVSARLALAGAMGVAVASEANAPLAEGPFPAAPTVEAVRALDPARLADEALGLRADRESALRLVESGRILSEAARRDLRDRFDLALSLSAGALGERSFSEAVDRWTGPAGSIALAYEKEIGKRSFRGRLGQNESLVRQREISAGDLERNIRIGVVEILRALEESVARLTQAEAAAGFFQETIDAEVEKLRAGASTLIDAIVTEQQRTGADLALVAARQQVAALLAQLRFETGTLVDATPEGGSTLPIDRLTTLPPAAGAAGGLP
jgi:outer membrane protein TolC